MCRVWDVFLSYLSPLPAPKSFFHDKKSVAEKVLSFYERRKLTFLNRAEYVLKQNNHCVASKYFAAMEY